MVSPEKVKSVTPLECHKKLKPLAIAKAIGGGIHEVVDGNAENLPEPTIEEIAKLGLRTRRGHRRTSLPIVEALDRDRFIESRCQSPP